MDEPEVLGHGRGHVLAFARTCPGKLDPNDDSAAVIGTLDGGLVLAVADGVGGSPVGPKASANAMPGIFSGHMVAEAFHIHLDR